MSKALAIHARSLEILHELEVVEKFQERAEVLTQINLMVSSNLQPLQYYSKNHSNIMINIKVQEFNDDHQWK